MIRLIILSLCLAGCTNITDLSDALPLKEIKPHHLTVEEVKKHYFTNEAYEAIENIPTVNGIAILPYAGGVNIISSLLAGLTGSGFGRTVVVPLSDLNHFGVNVLIHEYIHHLDDMTRDGEANFIDYNAFKKAYIKMSKDSEYAGIYIFTERVANDWITDMFGVGYMSEHIAYVGTRLALRGGPAYMMEVFNKMLR